LRIDRSGSVARFQNYDGGSVANIALNWEGGNVGIGTTSPSNLLEAVGSTFAQIKASNFATTGSNRGGGFRATSTTNGGTSFLGDFNAVSNNANAPYNGVDGVYVGSRTAGFPLGFTVNNSGTEILALNIASTGAATLSNLAGTGTRMVEASSAGLLSATKIVDAGTYTPTLANQSNVSAISAESGFTLAQYTRIGNQVTVSGTLNVTPTASNTQTAFTMTLPITGTSSNIGSGMLTSGTIAGNFISGFGLVFGSTNQVQFYFKSDGTSLMRIQYTFSYTL
jgi:hypothetical protein